MIMVRNIFLCLLLFGSFFIQGQSVVYVNQAYEGAVSNGLSWQTPFRTIEEAIDLAEEGAEIWIAKGEYSTPSENEEYQYNLSKSLAFIGGFEGDEEYAYERNTELNKTILTSRYNDSYSLLFMINAELHLTLDGLYLTKFLALASDGGSDYLTTISMRKCHIYDVTSSLFNITNGNLYMDSVSYAGNFSSISGTYNIVRVTNFKASDNHNSIFALTCHEEFYIADSEFRENRGSIFYVSNAKKSTITNCVFDSNTSSGSDWLNFSSNRPDSSEFLFTNSAVSDFTGATMLNVQGAFKSKLIRNCQFRDYESSYTMVSISGGINSLEQLTVENCNAYNLINHSGYGSVILSDVDFLSCTSTNMFLLCDKVRFNNVRIDGCENNGTNNINSSGFSAKNLQILNSKLSPLLVSLSYNGIVGNASLTDCRFENVQVTDRLFLFYGGNESKAIFNNCTFESVSAAGDGGIVYGSAMNLEFDNCIFRKNKTSGRGNVGLSTPGGHYITVMKSVFENNYAKEGAAIHSNGIINLAYCNFINNESEENGGAVRFGGSGNITVNNCLFTGNRAGNNGGAISSNGKMLVDNTRFTENVSANGTVYIENPYTADFNNCSFYKNISDNNPVVLHGHTTLRNSVVYGNIQLATEPLTLGSNIYNSIVWNNGFRLAEIYRREGIYGNSEVNLISFSNIQGGFEGEGNLDLDPGFVDPENGDFRLSCESPLINMGSNQYASGIPDAYGTPRIMAGRVDMGAYEFAGDPAVARAIPRPEFSFSNASACIGELVELKNLTPDTGYFTYKWGIGENTSLFSAVDTSYVYMKSGIYQVRLIATNACGKSEEITKELEVKPSLTPGIQYPTIVLHGDTTSFRTNALCERLDWKVTGGDILSGNGTGHISVKWGDGASGNGKVQLLATGCGRDELCELPVEIDVPVMAASNPLTGPSLVCAGVTAVYETTNKAFVPGSVYTWSVKGGSITGASVGYGLDSVEVVWSTISGRGVVYLTITNEFLKSAILDSVEVLIRYPFAIHAHPRHFCIGGEQTFNTGRPGDFVWKISGPENEIDEMTGKAMFGSLGGNYIVEVTSADPTAFCNQEDTLMIVLEEAPVIQSVNGPEDVVADQVYQYSVEYAGSQSSPVWLTRKSNYYMSGNPASVRWQFGEPYGFDVFVRSNMAGCLSDTIRFDVRPDFVYSVSGPDELCISGEQLFVVNEDPDNGQTYSWQLNGNPLSGETNEQPVRFNQPGYNTLNVLVNRKGMIYRASKRVLVKAAEGTVSVNGPNVIRPEGGGTYTYTISNRDGLTPDIRVIGAATYSLADSVLTVTWGANGPYQIEAAGMKGGEQCSSVPFRYQVGKAAALSKEITLQSGSLCPNTQNEYKIELDELAEDIRWMLDGGGTVVSYDRDQAIIQWGETPGEYTISVSYKRFGEQILTRKIRVNTNPAPQINETIVCGDEATTLRTMLPYSAYRWTLEPEGRYLSDNVSLQIRSGGIYTVRVTDQNGCTGVASANILAVPQPIARLTSSAGDICEGAGTRPVTLTAIEGADYTYEWYMDGQKINHNASVYTFEQDIATPGTHIYTLKVISSGVCTAEDQLELTVRTTSQCSGGGGDNDDKTCPDEVRFSVSGYQPFTFINTSTLSQGYAWDFGDGNSSSQVTNVQHTYAALGYYQVTLQSGCASHSVLVNVPLSARFAAPLGACQFEEIEFSDYSVNLPGYTYESWSWDFGNGQTSTQQNPRYSYPEPGSYTVRFSVSVRGDGGAYTDSFEKEITIYKTPEVDFTVQLPECNSDLVLFTDRSLVTTSEAIYSWDLGNGVKSGHVNPKARYAPGAKTVQLRITDYIGCSATSSRAFNILQPVESSPVEVLGNLNLCYGDSVLLRAPESSDSYIWKNGLTAIAQNSRELYIKESGNYSVDYMESDCRLTTREVPVRVFELSDAFVSFEQPGCEGLMLKVRANNVDTQKHSITWKLNEDALDYSGSEFTISTLSQQDAGIYAAIAEDNGTGCYYQLPVKELVVNSLPAKPVLGSLQSQLCGGDTIKVYNTVEYSFGYASVWSLNNVVLEGELSDTLAVSGVNIHPDVQLRITDNATGCSIESDPYTVLFGKIVQPVLSADIDACEHAYASIGVGGIVPEEYDFAWYKDGILLSNTMPRMDFASLRPADAGWYQAILTSKTVNGNVKDCIFRTDTTSVSVKPAPPQPVISGIQEFCAGDRVVLTSSVQEHIVWNTGDDQSSITVYEPGAYSVVVTNPANQCRTQASFPVTQNPLPDFRFLGTGVYDFCGSEPLRLKGLDSYPHFQWKLNGEDYGKANRDLYPRKSGNYTVVAVTDKNCTAESDTLRLKSLPCACTVVTAEDGLDIGSLRDAILCANTKAGPDMISFEIEGPGPHIIVLDSALPVIKETVAIDGFTQAGEGAYDIIIRSGSYAVSAFVQSDYAEESEFRGLQFENFDHAIVPGFGNNGIVIEKNRFLGRTRQSLKFSALTTGAEIKNNFFEGEGTGAALAWRYVTGSVVRENRFRRLESAVLLMQSDRNTIRDNIFEDIAGDALTLTLQSAENTVSGNTFVRIDSNAVAVLSSGKNTIRDNRIGTDQDGEPGLVGLNGIKTVASAGTRLSGNSISGVGRHGIVTDSLTVIENNQIRYAGLFGISAQDSVVIHRNVLDNNAGGGVFVHTNRVRISENRITAIQPAIKAIDLDGAGNGNKLPADFTGYEYTTESITISGTSLPGDVVELFTSEARPQQALQYAGKTTTGSDGRWSMAIAKGPHFDIQRKNYYVNTASAGSNTSELSGSYQTPCVACVCLVTNNHDQGENSLRAAVDSAHAGACTTIGFAISNTTIHLESELRPIEVPVRITGKPGIVLEGNGSGKAFTVEADHFNLTGLAFSNWETALALNGNKALLTDIQIDRAAVPVSINGDHNRTGGVCINCQSPASAAQTTSGIIITGNNNETGFAENPNRIFHAKDNGVLVIGGTGNRILYTTIEGSSKGIKHQQDGNNNHAAPAGLSGSLNENNTGIISGKVQIGDRVQFFVSDFTGKPASEFVLEFVASQEEFSVTLPAQYIQEGKNAFFVLTATDADGNTSEFSRVVKVGDNTVYCVVSNTQNSGEGSLRSAVDCVNEAGAVLQASAAILFDLPASAENTISVEGSGFEITNSYGVVIDPKQISIKVASGADKLPYAFAWSVSNVEMKNLFLHGFVHGIKIHTGSANRIVANTFTGNDTAVYIRNAGRNTLSDNTFSSGGLGLYAQNTSLELVSNVFGGGALGAGAHLSGISNTSVAWNRFLDLSNHTPGWGLLSENSSGLTIRNNEVSFSDGTHTGFLLKETRLSHITQNTFAGGKNSVEIVQSEFVKIAENRLDNPAFAGLSLDASDYIDISRNTAAGLAEGTKPIHLNYGQPAQSNKGLRAPEFISVTYLKGKVIYRGKAAEESIVEIFETSAEGRDLVRYMGQTEADRFGNFEFAIAVSPVDINRYTLRATSTFSPHYSPNPNFSYTSEASEAFNPNLKLCFVIKDTDEDQEGTLRYNINLANRGECSLMLFDVPVSGQVSIRPDSELPVITSDKLIIDATSQPGYADRPVVNILAANGIMAAFHAETSGDLSIHGIRTRGYASPVVISRASVVENSYCEFVDFTREGIEILSQDHRSIRLQNNLYRSEEADYIWNIDKPNLYAENDSLIGGKKAVAKLAGDSLVLVNNVFYAPEGGEGYTFTANGIDSLYARGNRIAGFRNGASLKEISRLYFIENDFTTANGSESLIKGMYVEGCAEGIVLLNTITGADTAISITDSEKLTCNSNMLRESASVGIYLAGSKEALVSSNMITQARIGIVVRSSEQSSLVSNTIYGHDSTGILAEPGSGRLLIASNLIGSESITLGNTSPGSGMEIYSSGNCIGGADTLANRVLRNERGGVLINGGTGNRITYNIFLDNDTTDAEPGHFAIWHKENGNESKASPVITHFEEVSRNWQYRVYGTSEPYDTIHLYRSDGHYQNARFFAGKGVADASGKWAVLADTTYFGQQLRHATLTLVATATDARDNTSQFSNIIYIGTCYTKVSDDNGDNRYPVPNSFRQAVLCANQQPDKALLLFSLNSDQTLQIPLRREMLRLDNPGGAYLNGLNLQATDVVNADGSIGVTGTRDSILITKGFYPAFSDTTVFWRISGNSDRTRLVNLHVQLFDTALVLQSPETVEISKMKFAGIRRFAIVLENHTTGAHLDSLQMMSSPAGALLSAGKGAKDIVLKNSIIMSAKSGVVAEGASGLRITGNRFRELPVAVQLSEIDTLHIEANTFTGGPATRRGLGIERSAVATITGNIFEKFEKGIPVRVSTSEKFVIKENTFSDKMDTTMALYSLSASEIRTNRLKETVKVSFFAESCDSVLFAENIVERTQGAGFDIVRSEKMKLSKNLIQSKPEKAGDLPLIDIHKGQNGVASNRSKNEPVIEGYMVTRQKDCGEEGLGIYLYGQAEPGDYIEIFASDTAMTLFKEFIVSDTADAGGKWMIRIPKEKYERDPDYIFSFSATATGAYNNTSGESETYSFDNVINRVVVTNTADSGPGSLRNAVDEINCSDLHTVVYFEIDELAPYVIVLEDTLPEIEAYLGFTMDGATQKEYNDSLKKEGDPTVTIDGSGLAAGMSLFVLTRDCDSSVIAGLTLLNTPVPVRLYNGGDRLEKLVIQSRLMRRDTAVLVQGNANTISGSTISGYERGIYIAGNANRVSGNILKDISLTLEIEGNRKDNTISENTIVPDSVAIAINGAQVPNFISKNKIGEWHKPLRYPAIRLHNASYQSISGSVIPYGAAYAGDTLSAFILIGDSSNYNTLSKNRIGMDDTAAVTLKGNMPGIRISTFLPGQKLFGNNLTGNEVAGLTVPALVINNAESGIIADNYFGVDSAYVQRDFLPHFKAVAGIDTTAILVMNSSLLTFAGNDLVNFRDYGIDVRSSDRIMIRQNKIYSEYSELKGIQLNHGTDRASNGNVQAPVIDTNDIVSQDRILLTGTSGYPQSEIQVFAGFTPDAQDTVAHSLRYIASTFTQSDGSWRIELPSSDFGFNKYNRYIAQVNDGLNSSEFSDIYTVRSLLCLLRERGIDLLGDLYEPCPESQFTLDAQLAGLHYEWTSDAYADTIRSKIAAIDTSGYMTLTLKDDFGCEWQEDFEVRYKERPADPLFIVSSNNFVSDTIVLVDVYTGHLQEYKWDYTDGLELVSLTELTSYAGPDSIVYAKGMEVRFIAPDTGMYTITQHSIRDGCFVKLDKDIRVVHKTPGQPDPYILDPGKSSLLVYPSPYPAGEGGNAFITTPGTAETEIQVLDELGRVYYSATVSGKKSYNIPLRGNTLPAGHTYIIKMNTGSTSLSYKFSVQ